MIRDSLKALKMIKIFEMQIMHPDVNFKLRKKTKRFMSTSFDIHVKYYILMKFFY